MGYRPNRYRFSLAHELAHRVLHKDIFSEVEFTDIAGWKAAMTDSIPEKAYGYLEWHANSFAGLVLVPPAQLQDGFFNAVKEAKDCGVDCNSFSDTTRGIMEDYIARDFEVSAGRLSQAHRVRPPLGQGITSPGFLARARGLASPLGRFGASFFFAMPHPPLPAFAA